VGAVVAGAAVAGAVVAGAAVAGAAVAGAAVGGTAVVAAGPQDESNSVVRTIRLTSEESIIFLLISLLLFSENVQSDINWGECSHICKNSTSFG
jgi:hypothetical protein